MAAPPVPLLDEPTTQLVSCDNYGSVIIIGVANQYSCEGGTCGNYGVVVMVGMENSYECGGLCWNQGLVVNAGGSYCGDDKTQVCIGFNHCIGIPECGDDTSECVPEGTTIVLIEPVLASTSSNSQTTEMPCGVRDGIENPPFPQFTVYCGQEDKPCGVALDPVCWTFRWICYNAQGPIELATFKFVTCETQPGVPSTGMPLFP